MQKIAIKKEAKWKKKMLKNGFVKIVNILWNWVISAEMENVLKFYLLTGKKSVTKKTNVR